MTGRARWGGAALALALLCTAPEATFAQESEDAPRPIEGEGSGAEAPDVTPPAIDPATATEPEEAETPWYRAEAPDLEAPAVAAPSPAPEGAAETEVEDAPADDDPGEEEAPDEDAHRGDFHFGSYGRVIAASDLEGRVGQPSNLGTWGPRITEVDTYAEIELRREDHFAGMHTQVVATVAYGGPLFHYDGEFSERIAIRNLFAEVRDLLTPGFTVWGGSRMWRGDDIYLMNFWPLDNLNLVGGGVSYALEDIGELSFAGGLSQPNDPFQRQEVLVPARAGFSPESVVFLDRPRLVLAGKLTWWPLGRNERDGIKAILYGEGHYLPSGERRNAEGDLIEPLPEDAGWVIGAQVGGYLSDSHTFVNLFFRYARGLGAYDPLGVPFREGSVIQTGRAEELRVGLSANWEVDAFGLQVGGYFRYFRDADPSVFGRGSMSEGVLDVRPHVWFGDYIGLGVDLSYQGIAQSSLNEATGRPEGGHIFRFAVLPFVSPFGRGTYTRPHIRVIYSVTARDDDARALYPVLDPRSARTVEHFLGLGVEWWFSSSSYGS